MRVISREPQTGKGQRRVHREEKKSAKREKQLEPSGAEACLMSELKLRPPKERCRPGGTALQRQDSKAAGLGDPPCATGWGAIHS